jgi:hypothetical protein
LITQTITSNDFGGAVTLSSGTGAVSITDTNSLTLAASTLGGTLTVNANDGLTLSGNVTTAGTITIDADANADGTGDFTINSSIALNSTNNAISITTADIVSSGSITAGSGSVTILRSTSGSIFLGTTGSGIQISGTELQNINASGLTIGAANNSIFVEGITAANSNNITGTVNLNASGIVTFQTTASTFNALAVNADDSINVDIDLTTDTGDLALDGDRNNAAGSFDDINFASGVTVTSAGSITLDATTGGITTTAAVTLNADNGITINNTFTASGDLTMDGDANNSSDGADSITIASGLTVSSTGTMTLDATTGGIVGSGALTINAADGIALNDNISAAGNLTLDGDSDNSAGTNDKLALAAGITLTSTSTGVLTLNATTGGIEAAGALTLSSNDGMSIVDDLTSTGSGTITIDTDVNNDGTGGFDLAAGKTITTNNNDLSITSENFQLNSTGLIAAGTGDVTILVSDGTTISVGLVGAGLSISTTELSNITANNLTIGDNTNDTMTIRGVVATDTDQITGTITFNATATSKLISIDTTASVFENSVTFNANAGIAVAVNLSTNVGNLILEGDSDNTTSGAISITGGVTITSAGSITLDATTGGLTTSGVATLNAANGIIINDSFTSTVTGTVTIDSDTDNNGTGDFTLASGTAINFSTNNNNFLITANDVTLSGTINNAAGNLVFTPSDGGTLGLGDANCGGTCGMTITGAEIQNLTNTSGGMVFGDSGTATTGNIFVDNVTAANTAGLGGSTNIQALQDNSSVTFTGSKSFFTATVDVDADDGIFINADVEALGSSARFDGDADNSADSSDKIIIADGVTLTSSNVGGGVFLDATTGGIEASGSVTLNGDNGVTINDNFTSTGTITIDTDVDDSGTGDLTLASGATLTTNNNDLSITANDITLTGSIAAGTGTVTIVVSDAEPIMLDGTLSTGSAVSSSGLCSATCGLTINGLEIQNITAGNLIIGDNTHARLAVDSISAAHTGNITGTITLNTTSNGSSGIIFGTTASTFAGALTANAGNGIQIGVGLTINGLGTFNAEVDNGVTGSFTITNSSTFTTNSNTINVTGAGLDIQAGSSINAGTGDVTYIVTNGRTIGLGDTSADAQIEAVDLQAITAANLTIGDSTAGNITVDNISLANSANISTTLTLITGGNVAFSTAASAITNNLVVNAGGDITQGVALSVGGTSDFTVTGTNVTTMTNASNDFTGAVTLASDTGAVQLTDFTDTILATSILGGNLTVISTGAITQTGALLVAGTSDFTVSSANAMTLTNTSNDFVGAVTLASGPGAVQLVDTTDTILAASTLGGAFTVTSSGAMTQTGALSVTGASSFTVSGSNAMTLTNASNAFTSAITLASGTGTAQLADSTATILAASTLGGALILNSDAGLTLSGNLTTEGTTTLEADSDANGVGNLALNSGVTLDTSNNALTLQGADINLSSATSVTSGSAGMTFILTTGLTADGNSLIPITASALTIDVTGNFILDGITSTTLGGISGLLTLAATGDVTFQNNASSHNGAVTVNADNDINVQVDVTSGGDFTAVADNDSSGAGDFVLDSGVTAEATAGDIDITAVQIEENGTLTASGDVIQNGVITQLNASDQTDVDSATDSAFVTDFTSPTEAGC